MKQVTYWPGTTIPKSEGNAFDLRLAGELYIHLKASSIKQEAGMKGAQAQQNRMPDGSAQQNRTDK